MLEPCKLFLEICPAQLVIEDEFDIGHPLELIEKTFIEPSTINRENSLSLLTIRLQDVSLYNHTLP